MDFLDPKKQRAHTIRLLIGYVLVGIALMITTTILLYQAYGFGLNKNGQVIQNGLVFVSSRPSSADIYLNGKRYKNNTDTRMVLPSGQYTFDLQREGYRAWKRAVTVEGGSVERFDYPLLIPTKLASSVVKKYDKAPGVVLQSPDHRWMIVQSGDSPLGFEAFDLNSPKTAPQALTLPDNAVTQGTGTQSWELVEWADDNRHVLLKHIFQKNDQTAIEFVLMDRQDPTLSINLNSTLNTTPTGVTLRNQTYDQYYVFDQTAATLKTASLKQPVPEALLEHVLTYAASGNFLLYATDDVQMPGKIIIKMRQDSNTTTLRQFTAAPTQYMLGLRQYGGNWYVTMGAQAENKLYVYKNPLNALHEKPGDPLVPVGVLKVTSPTYLSFSPQSRFVMLESGQRIALYDAEKDKTDAYALKDPLDMPATNVTWVDNYHLAFGSGGQLMLLDFDNANLQTLVATSSSYVPVFDRQYRVLYTLRPADDAPAQTALMSTPLRTAKDQ
jgi:PEGA domain